MSSSAIEQEVIDFLAQETGTKRHKLSLQTRLVRDLHVAGDDGVELMDKFSERFHVVFHNFEYDRYFGSEGCNPFWLLMPSYWKGLRAMQDITVSDLVRAAETGVWTREESS